MTQNPTPARLHPPGQILKRELEARGWTQEDLAGIIGRPASKISSIISGKKQITPETALELAEALGTSPEVWMRMEANYRLRLAQRRERESKIEQKSRLYSLLPIRELQKRAWIRESSSVDEIERDVLELLGARSLGSLPESAARFRGTVSKCPNPCAMLAWVNRAKATVRYRKTGPYSRSLLLSKCLPELLGYAERVDSLPRVPKLLAEFGITLVLLRHLPKTYVDGAALYLGRKPIVALSLRYDRIDSFWFTLLHEIAHIALKHGGEYIDDFSSETKGDEEKEASQAAASWLISDESWSVFTREVGPRFSKEDVSRFAHQINRHPGIVLGRLQYEGRVSYRNLRYLLEPVSPYMTDWIED